MRTNLIVYLAVAVFFCAQLCFCSDQKKAEERDARFTVGVKIYDHEQSFPELFVEWKDLGINTVLASESLLSNREFRNLAEKFNIATFVIVPIFFNPEELERARSSQERIAEEAGPGKEIEIREDKSVSPGGCIVETDLGIIDARLETQLRVLEKALLAKKPG